jgi:hypothetical protein
MSSSQSDSNLQVVLEELLKKIMLALIRRKIDAHDKLADSTSPNIASEKDVVHNPREHNKYSLPR